MGQRKTNFWRIFWRIITHLIFYICLGLVMFFSINYIFTQIILIAMVLFLMHTQQECPYKTEPISFPTWTMIVLGTYLLCSCLFILLDRSCGGTCMKHYESIFHILWIGFFVGVGIVLFRRRKYVLKKIDYIFIWLFLYLSPTISCRKECSIDWCNWDPQQEINFIFNNIHPWCNTVINFSVMDFYTNGSEAGCIRFEYRHYNRLNLDFFKDIFSEFWYGMQFFTIIIAIVVTVLYVQYRKRKTREIIEKTQEEGLSIQN